MEAESLAEQIRKVLGKHNQPQEPVTSCVLDAVVRIAALEAERDRLREENGKLAEQLEERSEKVWSKWKGEADRLRGEVEGLRQLATNFLAAAEQLRIESVVNDECPVEATSDAYVDAERALKSALPTPEPAAEETKGIAEGRPNRLDIVSDTFRHIAAHIREPGSFRYLIYERLGFGPEAYEPLYSAGGMLISNFIVEHTEQEVVQRGILQGIENEDEGEPAAEEPKPCHPDCHITSERMALYGNVPGGLNLCVEHHPDCPDGGEGEP